MTGTLISITAPTCSGKSFLFDALTRETNIGRMVSYTTRVPRFGEAYGRDYYFSTREELNLMAQEGKLCEKMEINGNVYATTWEELRGKTKGGAAAIILDPNGVTQYEHLCNQEGLQMLKVNVFASEELRMKRLADRFTKDVLAADDDKVFALLESSTQRLISRVIFSIREEAEWYKTHTWDVIVPGDDVNKAILMIHQHLN